MPGEETEKIFMILSELHAVDLVIILVYIIVLIFLGVFSVRKVKGMDDYYTAGHSLCKWRYRW